MFNLFAIPEIRTISFDWITNPTVLFTSGLVDIMINRESSLKYRDSGLRKDLAGIFSNLTPFIKNGELFVSPVLFLLSLIISVTPELRTVFDRSCSGRIPFITKLMLEHIRVGQFKDGSSLVNLRLHDSYRAYLVEKNLINTILDVDWLLDGNMTSAIVFIQNIANYSSPTSISKRDGYVKTTMYRHHHIFGGNTLGLTGMSYLKKNLLWHPFASFSNGIPSQLQLTLCNFLFPSLVERSSNLGVTVSHSNQYCPTNYSDDMLVLGLIDYILLGDADSGMEDKMVEDDGHYQPVQGTKGRRNTLKYDVRRFNNLEKQVDSLGSILGKLTDEVAGLRFAFE